MSQEEITTKRMEIDGREVYIECKDGKIKVYDATWFPFLTEIID
jgi:hypothetical protein